MLGVDFQLTKIGIAFFTPLGTLVDCYAGSAWPERFSAAELAGRRKKTCTINEWDSQYQCHSKPVTEVCMGPERIIPCYVQPPLRHANNAVAMFLGSTQNVGTVSCWGCSLGKIKSGAILSPTRNQRAFVLNITVIGWVVAGSILLAWRVQQVLIMRAL